MGDDMYIFKLILSHQIQINNLMEISRHKIEICDKEIKINDDEFKILKDISESSEYQYRQYHNIMHFDSHPTYIYKKINNDEFCKLYRYGLDDRFHVAFYYTWVGDDNV